MCTLNLDVYGTLDICYMYAKVVSLYTVSVYRCLDVYTYNYAQISIHKQCKSSMH